MPVAPFFFVSAISRHRKNNPARHCGAPDFTLVQIGRYADAAFGARLRELR